MQVAFRRFAALLVALGSVAATSGCVSTSDQLSAREAQALSSVAHDEAVAAMDAVLVAAGFDQTEPTEDYEIDGCSAVDYSFDSYGQWWISVAVPLEPSRSVAVVDQLSTRLALENEWRVIGDDPGEQSPESSTKRLVWSSDRTSDLTVRIEADTAAHVLSVHVESDCFLVQTDAVTAPTS